MSGLLDLLSDTETVLYVRNLGGQQVRVIVDARSGDRDRRDFLMNPGEAVRIPYGELLSLTTVAWRTSDLVEIFNDKWKESEIDGVERVDLYP